MDEGLSPDALFSPSKARQQRAQAHDWQHVETWLSSLYPSRALPTFERNEETLKALLALAAANERADEEAGLAQALEDEVRQEMSKVRQELRRTLELYQETRQKKTEGLTVFLGKTDTISPDAEADAELLHTIESNLTPDGQQSLSTLAQLSTNLNAPDTDPESLAHALIAQHTHHTMLLQQQEAFNTLRNLLTKDLQYLRTTLEEITSSPDLVASSSLPRQTADYQRQTKQLLPKLKEYEDRLAALGLPSPSPSRSTFAPSPTKSTFFDRRPSVPTTVPANQLISSSSLDKLRKAETEVLALRAEVAGLEAQVRAYKDLPAEREEARQVVREMEKVLEGLRARRDGQFEALVEK